MSSTTATHNGLFRGSIELGELRSGGTELYVVGWLSPPFESAVIVRAGFDESSLVLLERISRPDIARANSMPEERIYGFSVVVPVPLERRQKTISRLLCLVTLANGETHSGILAVRCSEESVASDTIDPSDTRKGYLALEHSLAAALLSAGQGLDFSPPSVAALTIVIDVEQESDELFACLRAIAADVHCGIEVLLGITEGAAPSWTRNLNTYAFAPELSLWQRRSVLTQAARGEVIGFLDPRCLLLPGSLSLALKRLHEEPGVAAIAPRVLDSDGLLVEAGPILWRDASSTSYGLGEDAWSGAFLFERDLDCCSSWFLLTRRKLLLEALNHLHLESTHAGLEYSLSLRAQRLRIVYLPYCSAIALREIPEKPGQVSFDEHIVPQHLAAYREQLLRRPGRGSLVEPIARESFPRRPQLLLLLDRLGGELRGLESGVELVELLDELGYRVTVYSLEDETEIPGKRYTGLPPGVEQYSGIPEDGFRSFLEQRHCLYDLVWAKGGAAVRFYLEASAGQPNAALIADLQHSPYEHEALSSELSKIQMLSLCTGIPLDTLDTVLPRAASILVGEQKEASALVSLGIHHAECTSLSPILGKKERSRRVSEILLECRQEALQPRLRYMRPSMDVSLWEETDCTPAPAAGPLGAQTRPGISTPAFKELPAIDIIIPIYRAAILSRRCLESVLRNSDIPFTLTIIDDASMQPEIDTLLEDLSRGLKPPLLRALKIMRNTANLGFTQTVNRGFAVTRGHAIILNSDTEVPPNWLSRMLVPLTEDPRVASVTPISNSATLCSFPKIGERNALFEGLDYITIDSFFKNTSVQPMVRIPTGVGFCMLLNRKALDAIGGFDAAMFGEGYGEENDWCLRAERAGYHHVAATNLFVFHNEGSSFDLSAIPRDIRKQRNLRRLEALHPGYTKRIADFFENDPLDAYRKQMMSIIAAASKGARATLYLNNPELFGGSQSYLRKRLTARRHLERQYTLVPINGEIQLHDLTMDTPVVHHFAPDTFTAAAFGRILEQLTIDEIFVNETVGLDLPIVFKLLRAATVPYTYYVHDYFSACPTVNLITSAHTYCGNETRLAECRSCLSRGLITAKHIGQQALAIDIKEWREQFGELLTGASSVIAPSIAAAQVLSVYYPGITIAVEPHKPLQRYAPTFRPAYAYRMPLRVGIVGAIGPPKGSAIVLELLEAIRAAGLPIELVVIGYTDVTRQPHKSADGKLTITGPYETEDLPQLLAKEEIGLVLIPSIHPETFSYATQESIHCGYPVMTFNHGGAAEQVRAGGTGWVVDSLETFPLVRELVRLLEAREEIVDKAEQARRVAGMVWEEAERSVESSNEKGRAGTHV